MNSRFQRMRIRCGIGLRKHDVPEPVNPHTGVVGTTEYTEHMEAGIEMEYGVASAITGQVRPLREPEPSGSVFSVSSVVPTALALLNR